MKRSVILTVFSLLVLVQLGWGQVPQTFSYQGVLRDKTTGELVDDTKYATFSIYDSEAAGTSVWTSGLMAVTVTDGVFNVLLGGGASPLPDPFPAQAWLGIKVDPDTEEMPRIELTSVPYSLNAAGVSGTGNVFPGSGKVGIGTIVPAYNLDVSGDVRITGDITLEGQDLIFAGNAESFTSDDSWLRRNPNFGFIEIKPNNATYGLYLRALEGNDYANFETQSGYLTIGHNTGDGPLYVTNANVGIGTASPGTKLEVEGASDDAVIVKIDQIGTDNYVGLNLERDDAEKWHIGMDNTNDYLRFRRTASSDDMVIDAAGNVGIGIATPAFKLEVAGDASILGDLNVQGTITQGAKTEYYSFGAHDVMGVSGNSRPDSTNYIHAYYDDFMMMPYSLDGAIPLHLPHGATITGITINVHDNDGTDATCEFYSVIGTAFTPLESSLTPHATVSSTGTGQQSPNTTLATPHTVDNQAERLWLRVKSPQPSPTIGAFVRFYGGYITYTVN